jgi:hypothetical protein
MLSRRLKYLLLLLKFPEVKLLRLKAKRLRHLMVMPHRLHLQL